MSLLGDPFDTIIAVISSVLSGISGVISAIFNLVGSILIFMGYLLYVIEVVISIILNPYLLTLYIVGTAFYYAVLTAHTRKDLLIRTGIYYKWVIETIPKIIKTIFELVVRLIVGIINII